MDLIDCDSKVRNISATTLWSEYKGASACLNPTSGAFSYGIYANAIPLTIETKLINKYVYALFWGLQVCILFFYFLLSVVINNYIHNKLFPSVMSLLVDHWQK
jgi:hypothetical protein